MEERIRPDERHLDLLALDALRAGEGSASDADHVASCARCRAALAGMVSLQETLANAQPRLPEVPRHREVRILRGYRDGFGRSTEPALQALLRRWALPSLGAAAAAALLLTVNPIRLGDPGGLPRSATPVAPAPEKMALAAPERRVDIVDAFLLARALRDGGQAGPGSDADGNGLVDEADVRHLARRAVAL